MTLNETIDLKVLFSDISFLNIIDQYKNDFEEWVYEALKELWSMYIKSEKGEGTWTDPLITDKIKQIVEKYEKEIKAKLLVEDNNDGE